MSLANRNLFLIWGLSLILLGGCGYTLKHRLKDQFTSPKGIFVPVFDNQTDEIGAERVFTNALIRELQSHDETVLSGKDENGLELQGTIRKIEVRPTSFTDLGFKGLATYRRIPSEIGVGVTILFSLIESKSRRTLWMKEFGGFARITAPMTRTIDENAPSSVGYINQSNAESIFPETAVRIMRDAYDDMVDLF